jgi:nucleoside-diphosphate-sugar epimerase
VVEANLLAATSEKAPGSFINVAAGGQHTLNHLIALLEKVTGRPIERRHTESRPGDVKHSFADVTRARELLGYEPLVSLEEGLRRTVEWHQRGEAQA